MLVNCRNGAASPKVFDGILTTAAEETGVALLHATGSDPPVEKERDERPEHPRAKRASGSKEGCESGDGRVKGQGPAGETGVDVGRRRGVGVRLGEKGSVQEGVE